MKYLDVTFNEIQLFRIEITILAIVFILRRFKIVIYYIIDLYICVSKLGLNLDFFGVKSWNLLLDSVLTMPMRFQVTQWKKRIITQIAPIWSLKFVEFSDVSILELLWIEFLFANIALRIIKDFMNFHMRF
jgi:hypothetical protein